MASQRRLEVGAGSLHRRAAIAPFGKHESEAERTCVIACDRLAL